MSTNPDTPFDDPQVVPSGEPSPGPIDPGELPDGETPPDLV